MFTRQGFSRLPIGGSDCNLPEPNNNSASVFSTMVDGAGGAGGGDSGDHSLDGDPSQQSGTTSANAVLGSAFNAMGVQDTGSGTSAALPAQPTAVNAPDSLLDGPPAQVSLQDSPLTPRRDTSSGSQTGSGLDVASATEKLIAKEKLKEAGCHWGKINYEGKPERTAEFVHIYDAKGAAAGSSAETVAAGSSADGSEDAHVDLAVQTVLKKHWGLKDPTVLIEVTGSAGNLHLPPRLVSVFKRGIVKASPETNAWVFTGGAPKVPDVFTPRMRNDERCFCPQEPTRV